jgi:BASS family bile acid:Na+ symporter
MPLMNILVDARFWIMSALAIGLIVGDTGHAPTIVMISLMVLMCISLQGLTFSKKDITDNRKEVLIGVFVCYVVAGGVTLLVGSFYDHDLWLGWVMIAAVPCAISVTSGTLILKGNIKLAMITTTVIYLVALVATPVITKILIGEAVSPAEVLKYVALFIVIPFAVSIPLRKFKMNVKTKAVSVNILFFILVFITFGANKEFIFNEPATVMWVVAGCLVRIAAVAFSMELILKWIGMKRDGRIPMVLLSIWKNSALAMSMTMILISTTHSVLPAALSLPIEMMWFMFMIWYYSKRCPPSSEKACNG